MASWLIDKREPRYVVQELGGYLITPNGSGQRGNYKTSFYILDLLDNARIVHIIENRDRATHYDREQMRRKAKAIARRMNVHNRRDLENAGRS